MKHGNGEASTCPELALTKSALPVEKEHEEKTRGEHFRRRAESGKRLRQPLWLSKLLGPRGP